MSHSKSPQINPFITHINHYMSPTPNASHIPTTSPAPSPHLAPLSAHREPAQGLPGSLFYTPQCRPATLVADPSTTPTASAFPPVIASNACFDNTIPLAATSTAVTITDIPVVGLVTFQQEPQLGLFHPKLNS